MFHKIVNLTLAVSSVATLGMFERLGKILKGILSTQLPNKVIFKPYFQYLNKKRQERIPI
jgi:hypothetical protein